MKRRIGKSGELRNKNGEYIYIYIIAKLLQPLSFIEIWGGRVQRKPEGLQHAF